jgi:nucleoside-diphosphate-sugar epimerase
MKVFLAGSTGVVGRRLVPLLVEAGHEVTGVARSEEKARGLERQGVRPVTVDLFDAGAVSRAVAGHDVVINMATHIPSSSKVLMPGAFKENNRIRREASRNLSNAAIKAGAERFIQESFAAVYPDRGDEWIDERVPIEPAKYVRTVVDAERAAADFTRRGGGAGVSLRFAFFYGPDNSFTRDIVKLVKKGVAPSVGRAEGFMSSLWIDDGAAAVFAALNVPAGVYNVTDDEPVRRRQAFDALALALGVRSPRMLPEWLTKLMGSVAETLGRSLRLSNARFREASGWSPKVRSVIEGWPLVVNEAENLE